MHKRYSRKPSRIAPLCARVTGEAARKPRTEVYRRSSRLYESHFRGEGRVTVAMTKVRIATIMRTTLSPKPAGQVDCFSPLR